MSLTWAIENGVTFEVVALLSNKSIDYLVEVRSGFAIAQCFSKFSLSAWFGRSSSVSAIRRRYRSFDVGVGHSLSAEVLHSKSINAVQISQAHQYQGIAPLVKYGVLEAWIDDAAFVLFFGFPYEPYRPLFKFPTVISHPVGFAFLTPSPQLSYD